MAAKNAKDLIPPDETLWQKYSAHFELPLAGVTSMFLHGLVVAMIVLGGIGFLFVTDLEATKPPKMDVVMIEGEGTGFEGLGGEPGLPGNPDAGGPKRTEQIDPLTEQPDPPTKGTPPRLLKDPPLDLGLPLIDDGQTPANSALSIELAKLARDADEQVKKAMKIEPPRGGPPAKVVGIKGSGAKGVGGLGGKGGGPGKGNKKGAGIGTGGFGGRKATKQEIYAMRWHFDLAGDPREHVRKLAAIGFTVAFPDPRGGGFFVVTDLNRQPAEMRRDNLMGFQEAVKWYNTKPDSVQGLARELQLQFVPRFVVLLLPKDREDQMAQAEKAYADRQRRDLRRVTMTRFDFRLRNGTYDPTVMMQK
ncbi:MAG: hypothetical protein HYX68_18315 [Planctomycetes bacterium]|nr:hypothetical protein [Planctomycetota bacterium]